MEAEKEAVASEKGKGVVAGGRIITLKSSDGELRLVSEAAASLSGVISRAIAEGCAGDTVDLPNVAASTLDKVLEYCNKHADPGDAAATRSNSDPTASTVAGSSSRSSSVNDAASEDLEVWDRELLDPLSMYMDALYDLLLAAYDLEIEGLLDALCQKVADMIKGKTPGQIRRTFNLENDFTEEEKSELLQENAWAFDYDEYT